jgi:hypothetical protein
MFRTSVVHLQERSYAVCCNSVCLDTSCCYEGEGRSRYFHLSLLQIFSLEFWFLFSGYLYSFQRFACYFLDLYVLHTTFNHLSYFHIFSPPTFLFYLLGSHIPVNIVPFSLLDRYIHLPRRFISPKFIYSLQRFFVCRDWRYFPRHFTFSCLGTSIPLKDLFVLS